MEAVVGSSHIDLIETVKVLGRGVEHIADVGDACVVHQHIESGEVCKGGTDGLGARDIHRLDRTRAASLLKKAQRLPSRFGGEFKNANIVSIGGELEGGGAADTGSGSSNDGDWFLGMGCHGMR